jgi:hypothetical protein
MFLRKLRGLAISLGFDWYKRKLPQVTLREFWLEQGLPNVCAFCHITGTSLTWIKPQKEY